MVIIFSLLDKLLTHHTMPHPGGSSVDDAAAAALTAVQGAVAQANALDGDFPESILAEPRE